MKNTYKALLYTCYIMIFCISITLLLMESRSLNRLLLSTKKIVIDSKTIYEEYNYEPKESVITKAELITILMNEIDYSIQIDDIYLEKKNFNSITFDFGLIQNSRYKRKVIMNNNGYIEKIIYIGMNNY